jgi:hypothetical protein
MAGTGGTSSSATPAELCTFRDFGVGSLEDEDTWLFLEVLPPFGCRKELKLELEESEPTPEIPDLRAKSGVPRAEEGVSFFRCGTTGECRVACRFASVSGCGVNGACGIGGRGGAIDSRFNLRASVGLIVRAPNPPWCIVDCLLLPLPDDGVGPRCAVVRPGEDPGNEGAFALTGVVTFGLSSPCEAIRTGGCKDFVRTFRVAVVSRGPSEEVAELGVAVTRELPLFIEVVRDKDPDKGCASRAALLSSNPCVIKLGPTDFLGWRAALGAVTGGPVGRALCRRPRAENGALGGGIAEESAAADCVGFRRALLNRRAREELLETFPTESCPRPIPIPRSTTAVGPRPLSPISGRVGDSNLPLVPGAGKLSNSAS